MIMYDPPMGWKHGFPKPYEPLYNETLEKTLLRDGYPQEYLNQGLVKCCKFIGSKEEVESLGTQPQIPGC